MFLDMYQGSMVQCPFSGHVPGQYHGILTYIKVIPCFVVMYQGNTMVFWICTNAITWNFGHVQRQYCGFWPCTRLMTWHYLRLAYLVQFKYRGGKCIWLPFGRMAYPHINLLWQYHSTVTKVNALLLWYMSKIINFLVL